MPDDEDEIKENMSLGHANAIFSSAKSSLCFVSVELITEAAIYNFIQTNIPKEVKSARDVNQG